jgi:hypothetical protein
MTAEMEVGFQNSENVNEKDQEAQMPHSAMA